MRLEIWLTDGTCHYSVEDEGEGEHEAARRVVEQVLAASHGYLSWEEPGGVWSCVPTREIRLVQIR